MASLIVVVTYDLHVKCDLCSFEWIDKKSHCPDKMKCPNCKNTVNYEMMDIIFQVK